MSDLDLPLKINKWSDPIKEKFKNDLENYGHAGMFELLCIDTGKILEKVLMFIMLWHNLFILCFRITGIQIGL